MWTNFAKESLADQLQSNSDISDWKYIGFGTDDTAATLGDTALGAEVSGGSYARGTATQGEGDADTYRLTLTWTNNSAAEQAIEEIGVFDAATAGNLIGHFTTTDGDFSSFSIPVAGTAGITINLPFNDSSE